MGAVESDGTPYVVIIHKAPSEDELFETAFTPGVGHVPGSGSALGKVSSAHLSTINVLANLRYRK